MSAIDVGSALQLLQHGEISVEGRLVDASNATLFCDIELDGAKARCVYKPVAGERPLWDFPDGTLAAREVATYAVSEATGWDIVPPTVMRDGPFGPGMCQLWVDSDPGVTLIDVTPPSRFPDGWLRVLDALGSGGQPVVLGHADDVRLRRMAVLDTVVNNADRKGGHVLPLPNVEPKLRTVLWGWAGDPLTAEETWVLSTLTEQLDGDLGTRLSALLTGAEVRATRRRLAGLLGTGRFALPAEGWPSIPWPPF
jgi:uncharacterized repeat protein (TIGR03843 family)